MDFLDRRAAMWLPPPPKGEGEVGVLQGDHMENLIKPWSFWGKVDWGLTSHFLHLLPSTLPPVLHYHKSKTKVGKYFLQIQIVNILGFMIHTVSFMS